MKQADLPRFAELDAEYEIVRELGRGGTAVVYLARERELDRNVAIKVIRSTYIEDEEAAARLMREARTVGGLQHPNIVMLYGTRRLGDNSLALIMQYVAGRTLRGELDEHGRLPFDRVHRILSDLGSALECAHRHRIVHRDIKPENIYLDDESGSARLSDFGIARPWDGNANLTVPGTAIGTPAYMSPEQIDGDPLDGRSDLYSLGLVGYEMLTGVAPWSGETLYSIIYRQKHAELASLVELRPDVPPVLLHAVDRALHKHRDARWPDATTLLAALGAATGVPRAGASAATGTIPARTSNGAGSNRTPSRHGAADGRAAHDAVSRRTDGSRAHNQTPQVAARDSATMRFRRDGGSAPVRREIAADPQALVGTTAAEASDVVTVISSPAPRRPRSRHIVAAAVGLVVLAAAVTAVLTQWPAGGAVLSGATNETGAARPELAAPAAPPPVPVSTGADVPDAPSIAATVAQLLGDRQQGLAGDTLPERLLLLVTDSAGEPVEGAMVRFSVSAGHGAVTPPVAATDEFGVAGAHWVVRDTGMQTVTAAVDDIEGEPVTFHATALPRPPARLRASGSADIRATAGSRTPLTVIVDDDRGDPLAGVPVRFSVRTGDGSIADADVTTDEDGSARVEWLLGSAASQEAAANTLALPDATILFRAHVRSAPLSIRSALTVGGTHTCFLATDGAARCWGGNDNGQLGDGSTSRRSAPVRVVAAEPFAVLSAGVAHTCALGLSGSVFCWGSNSASQLGTRDRTPRSAPIRIAVDVPMSTVAAGMAHSCALDAVGRAYCWGQNTHGQLGDGTRVDRTAPVQAAGERRFRGITVGWAHTCALAMDRTAYCWGRNTSGELGSTGGDRTTPVRVRDGDAYTNIAAGSSHTCALRIDGAILCWGQNTHGQLGNGGTENSTVPAAVESLTPFSTVSVGGVHTCALTRDGVAWCWGRNTYGQLGNGSTQDASRPTAVDGGLRFSGLYASGAHTCGSTRDGARYCWGFNLEGQLGDGTRTNRSRPVAVTSR